MPPVARPSCSSKLVASRHFSRHTTTSVACGGRSLALVAPLPLELLPSLGSTLPLWLARRPRRRHPREGAVHPGALFYARVAQHWSPLPGLERRPLLSLHCAPPDGRPRRPTLRPWYRVAAASEASEYSHRRAGLVSARRAMWRAPRAAQPVADANLQAPGADFRGAFAAARGAPEPCAPVLSLP